MKKKGFTESQIIMFLIFGCIILLVLVPFLTNLIKNYQKKIENNKINKIIVASKSWLNNLKSKETIDGRTYYVSTDTLLDKKFLNKELLSGCVKIVYQENIKDYNYMYNAISCESIMSGKDILLNNVITSGEGLYNNNDVYIYKGNNPNNYIKINNNLYRILRIDENGIRIITNSILEDRSWDSANMRSIEKNSYCASPDKGCNAYVSNTKDVTQDSEINQYLENVYMNTLTSKDTLLNNNAVWNVGLLGTDFSVDDKSKKSSKNTISNSVGLLSIDDYIDASINSNYTKNNWLNIGKKYWTLTGLDGSNSEVWYIDSNGSIKYTIATDKIGVRPVLNINIDKKITGNGTEEDPYLIK